MMLIADSGSTKTDWHLCSQEMDFRMHTSGLHPRFSDKQAVHQELISVWPDGLRMEAVSMVHFYGSGCLKPAGADIIHSFLTAHFRADIFVHSDLEGAAISTLKDRPGITAILGTGSSAALWDGNAITSLSTSLGYLLGDEGSGADIAKHLLRDILYGEAGKEISERFFQMYPLPATQIISDLYSHPEPASHLAAYCHFVNENKALPYCIQLLQKRFSAFIQTHLIPLQENEITRIGFNGSIAYAYEGLLRKELQQAGFSDVHILQAPIDALVQHHKKEEG